MINNKNKSDYQNFLINLKEPPYLIKVNLFIGLQSKKFTRILLSSIISIIIKNITR